MANKDVLSLTIQPVRSVWHDTVRNRKWIKWFVLGLVGWVVISATAFHFVEQNQMLADGSHVNGFVDSLYFTVVNVTTVGFGDIVPKSDPGKFLAMANAIVGVLAFGFLVAIFSAALQPSEFVASGTVANPASHEKPRRSRVDEEMDNVDSDRTIVSLLRSLDTLMRQGGEDRQHSHLRVRIREGESLPRNMAFDIEIMIHRWP